MSEKPLCGHCYNECTDDCCDKRRIDVLERKLAEAREDNTELLIKLKVHKNKALSLAENVKFRELKEKGE